MSQTTYLDSFNASSIAFITSTFVAPIVKYFKENPQEEITEDKILEILSFPVAKPSVRATTQSLTAAPKRTRSAKTTGEFPQCKWIFTKGAKLGNQCTSSSTGDSEYCSACKSKRGAGGTGRKTTPGDKSEAPTKSARGGAKPGFTPTPKEAEADFEISVEEFAVSTEGLDLLYENQTGFILEDKNGVFSVVGFCDNHVSKTMRPLTKEEKDKARKLFQIETRDGVTIKK